MSSTFNPEDFKLTPKTVGAIDIIKNALSAALAEARTSSGIEGEMLDIATAMALTALVMDQGHITPQIPISVTRSLMEMIVQRGYGKYLGVVRTDEELGTLQ